MSLHDESLNVDSDLRCKVAREAATLLYFGAEKEYKQAKLKAAKTFSVHFLPSNLEVALELDRIAATLEGPIRKERLIQMRKDALKIMKTLRVYRPVLIGSVWRGTIRQGSDIDIAVCCDLPNEVLDVLKKSGFQASETGWTTITKRGKPKTSFHIHVETSGRQTVEVVVRSSEEAGWRRKCEIFGDELKGLNIQELENLLKQDPARKFIPV